MNGGGAGVQEGGFRVAFLCCVVSGGNGVSIGRYAVGVGNREDVYIYNV